MVVFANSFVSSIRRHADAIRLIKRYTNASFILHLWRSVTRCMGSTSSQLQKTMKLTKLSMGVHASTHAPRRTRQKVTPGLIFHKTIYFFKQALSGKINEKAQFFCYPEPFLGTEF